ncbi:MAG: lysophospholipid acyltransferase family protein [Hyphomicrobiales bacterium]|nr:lysophospholipid acyltransferase family protein [Hyphomicrobiales bacterium]
MREGEVAGSTAKPARKRRQDGAARRLWRRIRKPLATSRFTMPFVAWFAVRAFRLVYWTNPLAEGSDDTAQKLTQYMPAILTQWHGQHLLSTFDRPRHIPVSVMLSRSADAELNALMMERNGFRTVRGSGGRDGSASANKGGARALIALKKSLDAGSTVAMIADIPHGTPRQAGMGIITLARISGRPILPVAYATSRRKVLDKTWDKTTVNLPFGHRAVVFGEPVYVGRDADEAELEEKRRAVTAGLNAANAKAYALVDGRR